MAFSHVFDVTVINYNLKYARISYWLSSIDDFFLSLSFRSKSCLSSHLKSWRMKRRARNEFN